MAISGCALRFHRGGSRVGVDSVLADTCGGDSNRDRLARKVSECATIVLDSAVGVAFLDGVCGSHLDSFNSRSFVLDKSDRGETLIEGCIPENIARWKFDWRHEVVSEPGLFTCREAHNVRGRVSAVLFARPRIHYGLAQPVVDVAHDHPWGAACFARRFPLDVGEFHLWRYLHWHWGCVDRA